MTVANLTEHIYSTQNRFALTNARRVKAPKWIWAVLGFPTLPLLMWEGHPSHTFLRTEERGMGQLFLYCHHSLYMTVAHGSGGN